MYPSSSEFAKYILTVKPGYAIYLAVICVFDVTVITPKISWNHNLEFWRDRENYKNDCETVNCGDH